MSTRSFLKRTESELKKNACRTYGKKICTLCPYISMDYSDELRAKQNAFQSFFDAHTGFRAVETIMPSPLSRNYRTNTKRRVYYAHKNTILALSGPASTERRPLDIIYCPIEPVTHNQIYNLAQDFLLSGGCSELCKSLNYIIIKGSYNASVILFSLKYSNGKINQKINELSKMLTSAFPSVTGLHMIFDDDTGYYISDKVYQTPKNIKKIFGADGITVTVQNKKFYFTPLVFSQTNTSILEPFTGRVLLTLKPEPVEHIYDLYCGYGLFGLFFADHAASVTGMEMLPEAVRCARLNAKHNRASRARWITGPITKDSIHRLMAEPRPHPVLFLDPPRNGADSGVIQALSRYPFKKILHVFCNREIIPHELKQWTESGYRIEKMIPVDMFPATEHVEIMALLIKK